jgi:hypothetical protein
MYNTDYQYFTKNRIVSYHSLPGRFKNNELSGNYHKKSQLSGEKNRIVLIGLIYRPPVGDLTDYGVTFLLPIYIATKGAVRPYTNKILIANIIEYVLKSASVGRNKLSPDNNDIEINKVRSLFGKKK